MAEYDYNTGEWYGDDTGTDAYDPDTTLNTWDSVSDGSAPAWMTPSYDQAAYNWGVDPTDYATEQEFIDATNKMIKAEPVGKSWWDKVLTPSNVTSGVSGASSLLTNYLGGTAAKDASKKALASLNEAYARAGQTSTDQYTKALELGRPYRELGAALMPTYSMFASGASPGRQTLGQLANGGLYDWQKQQTLDAIDKQMAARGRFDSGANIRARTDAVAALSGAEAENQFQRNLSLENMDYGRLSDSMNLGAGFSNQGAGLAVSTGNTLASVYGAGGNASAAQQNNIGSATKSMYTGLNNAVQGGLNTYNTNQLLNQLGGL